MFFTIISRFGDIIEQLPDVVVDRLSEEQIESIREKGEIPREILESLPDGIVDQIPTGLVEAATSNPLFAGIAVLALLGFIYGVVKSAAKAMLFFGAVSALFWFFFFQS